MKVLLPLNLLALAATLCVTTTVHGAVFELNGGSCEEADRKQHNSYFTSESESFYGPVDPTTLDAIPVECRPTNTDVYGAWYKINVVGSANMTLDSLAYIKNGPNIDLTLTVLEGSCDLLTCVNPVVAALPNSEGVREATTTFSLKANTRYFLFYSVANVPGAGVPWIGLQTATAEAACNYYRSQQINFDSYTPVDGLGSCTPCEQESVATSSTTTTSISIRRQADPAATTGATVWKTTCIDACQRCYSVAGAPFCYTESRRWSMMTNPSGTIVQPAKITPCYNFPDGTIVCDQGIRDGACPLEINGVECSSCTNQFGATNCVKGGGVVSYSNFKVDCSNVAGGGIADKCLDTGFDTSPALYNYGVYTDIVLANTYREGETIADVSSTYSTCEWYTEEGIPVNPQTSAPTPLPDDPLPLLLDDETDEFDIIQGQSKVYTIDITGAVGVLKCEVKGDNGDADLYVGLDVVPLMATFDGCKSELFGSDEECSTIVDNDRTTANVIVFGYRAATDVTLECKLDDLDDARDFDAFAVDKEDKFGLKASEYRLYKMEVPSGSQRVACTTRVDNPTEDDIDMFMRIGGMPVPYVDGKTDCVSDSLLGDEDCELTEYISNDNLYILLRGYGNVTEARFTCEVMLEVCGECMNSDDAKELKRGERKSGLTLLENENRLFYMVAPEDTKKVECWVETDNGDVDLYLRVGEVPVLPDVLTFEGGIYDCGSLTGGSGDEYCYYDWPNNGNKNPVRQNLYALITGYEATKDISIKCDGDIPLTKDDARELDDGDSYTTNLAREEEKLFVMKIDERVDRMLCETSADSGDVDMYSKKDEVPKSQDGWDQTDSANSGSDESIEWDFCCGVDDGSNGDEEIYILLRGFDEVRGMDIRCKQYFILRKDDARTLSDDSRYSTNLDKGEEKLFRFRVDEAVDYLRCESRSDSGRLRMYSKKNEVPKRQDGWDQVDGDDWIEWNFSGCVADGACGDEEIYIILYADNNEEARDAEIRCTQFFMIVEEQPDRPFRNGPGGGGGGGGDPIKSNPDLLP